MRDLTKVKVYTSGDLSPWETKTINENTVLLDVAYERCFYEANPGQVYQLNYQLGHEFMHVVQARTIPYFFWLKYPSANVYYGYKNNPYELEARHVGLGFSRYMLGK